MYLRTQLLNTPNRGLTDFVQLSDRVAVHRQILGDTRTFCSSFIPLRTTEYHLAENEPSIPDGCRKEGAERLVYSEMDRTKAMFIAESWLAEHLTSDAVLEAPTPIQAPSLRGRPVTIGYSVQYTREKDRLPVKTNGTAIRYSVLVNNNDVAASSGFWPTIRSVPADHSKLLDDLISVGDSVQRAVEEIDGLFRSPVRICGVAPCYGLCGRRLHPAHVFSTSDDGEIVVRARTGVLLE